MRGLRWGSGRGLGPLVLEYHAVSEAWQGGLAVTPAQLRRQLEWLIGRGYRGATFSEAIASDFRDRIVAVTFDDAYLSVYDNAFPILASLGLPATVFVVTDFADDGRPLEWRRGKDWRGSPFEDELRGMTWDLLAELAAAGWEIGSHTRTHSRLTELSDEALDRELRGSREACERALGRPCSSLAYPFGDFDARVARAAAAAGYTAAAIEDLVRPQSLTWPRVGIYRPDSMLRFRVKVSPTRRRIRTALARQDTGGELTRDSAPRATGLRVLAVTNMYPTPEQPELGSFVASQVESLRQAGVAVDVLHLRREQGRRIYRGLGKRVEKLAAELGADLVHVMYGGVMADAVTRAVRTSPVVVSFCGSDLLGGPAPSGTLSVRFNLLASRRAARRADGLIVKSRNLFNALPAEVDRDRAWIVPNGVDFDRFRPLDRAEAQRRLGWDSRCRHVLFPAGRGRPEKRYALAQESVQRLIRSGARVELHTLERVRHEDVPFWLNAANAVLLTSALEGSPNAVKEALACDVPVVSVDVGDVSERLARIDGCFLADPTPEDIAKQLDRALAGPGRVDGRSSIADLALDRVAAKVCEIYALLVGRSSLSTTVAA